MTTRQKIEEQIKGFMAISEAVSKILGCNISDWDPNAYGKGRAGIELEQWDGKGFFGEQGAKKWMPIEELATHLLMRAYRA